jgi:acetyltransferase-like isoleucine patch superfamily enzyme
MNVSGLADPTVKIFSQAKIIAKDGVLSIGRCSQIDDFAFVNAGSRLAIGMFVHISSFCSIVGGGECELMDFCGLSAGCRIVTGSDDFSGGYLTNPTVSPEFKNISFGKVVIGRHVVLGSNVVVMPGVSIGDGATVGAGSIVTKDLDPWAVYAGFSPRKIGERDCAAVLAKEAAFLSSLSR